MKQRVKQGILVVVLMSIVPMCNVLAQTVSLSGKITGADGKPLKAAAIEILRNGASTIDTAFVLNDAGTFSFSVSAASLAYVRCSGVDCIPITLPILATENIQSTLTVQLAPVTIPTRIDSVVVVGEFNQYNVSGALLMSSKKGVYSAAIPTVNGEAKYQVYVLGSNPRGEFLFPIAGSSAKEFELGTRGTFVSVEQSEKEQHTVSVDLDAITKSQPKNVFTFSNQRLQKIGIEYTRMVEVQRFYKDSVERELRSISKSGVDMSVVRIDNLSAQRIITTEGDSISARLQNEQDELVRDMIYMRYLNLQEVPPRRDIIDNVLRDVQPKSALWGLNPSMMFTVVDMYPTKPELRNRFVEEAVSLNPDRSVVGIVLFNELLDATNKKEKARAVKAYNNLTKNYAEQPVARTAEQYFKPDRKIQIGEKLGAIAATSTDGKTKISTNSLKGKTVLVECIASSSTISTAYHTVLQGLYKKYKAKGLEILTLSFDSQTSEAKALKAATASNPWLSALAEKGLHGETATNLDAHVLPKVFLVSPQGVILAEGATLRTTTVEQTLEEALNQK